MLSQVKRRPLLLISSIALLLILIIAAVSIHNLLASGQAPTPRGIICGTLYLHGYNGPAYDVKGKREAVQQIGNCFWNAYQHCHTATLTVYQRGVDTGTTSIFIIDQSQGTCALTDTAQFHSANFGGSHSSFKTYTCTGLSRSGNDLHLIGCGDVGDILVSL